MNFQQQIAQSLTWRGLYFATVLVMNIFLSRYFEAGNAGWIFFLSNNFSFILIIAGLTIENGVSYYASRGDIHFSRLTWFSLVWSVLVGIVVFTGLWLYFSMYKQTAVSQPYLLFAICYVAGLQLTNFFTVLFYAQKNFFLPNFLMVLLNLGFIMLIPKQVGTANTNTNLMVQLYFAFFVVNGLVLAGAFVAKNKSWKILQLPNVGQCKLLIRYALFALSANLVFFLVYRVDYWFVQRWCSAEELGNYIQVSKLAQMLLIIPTIISSVVFPHTAGGMHRAEMAGHILRVGRLLTALYLVVLTGIVLLGGWLFPVVFGNTYDLMYWPFILLMPGVWALSNLFVLSAYFGGTNQLKVNVKGAVLGLIVIIIGDLLFIKPYGIQAGALISTAGYGVNFAYAFYHLKKEHSVSFAEYWTVNKADIQWLKTVIQR